MLRSLNNYDFFIDERIGQIYNEGDLSWERSQALELAKLRSWRSRKEFLIKSLELMSVNRPGQRLY